MAKQAEETLTLSSDESPKAVFKIRATVTRHERDVIERAITLHRAKSADLDPVDPEKDGATLAKIAGEWMSASFRASNA